MPDNRVKTLITFNGGWATDFGPVVPVPPKDGVLPLPYLVTAENVMYELDGAPHKVGGTTKVNTTAQSTIWGFADCWWQGAAGLEVNKQVAYIGTQWMKMDALNGTWTSLKTGLESGNQPCFEMFKGTNAVEMVIMTTNSISADVPQRWNNSDAATTTLGGSPPKFSFMVKHQNRLWAAGVPANPSRLHYSESLDPETWSGGGSGSIDIDPGDGDRITGIASHKNELIVFKGPNRLSIHRITGATPSTFARVPFVDGVGSYNHSSIFRVNDDLVFLDARGIHSLTATAAYGDYVEAFLSRPILTYYQDNVNHNSMTTVWGCNYQAKGMAIWTVPASGSTVKTEYLVYDYRFQPGRWAHWTGYQNANCLGTVLTGRQRRLFAGTTTGFLYQVNVADRSVGTADTAYTMKVVTPYLNFGSSAVMKNVVAGFLSQAPKGTYNTTFGWTRDTATEQTALVNQAGSADTLG